MSDNSSGIDLGLIKKPLKLISELFNMKAFPEKTLTVLRNTIRKYYRLFKNLRITLLNYEDYSDRDLIEHGIDIIESVLLEFKDQYEIAKSIQNSIFPSKLPDNQNISIKAKLVSLYDTTGDFYDVVSLVPNKVYGVLISDITGHGVSAALVTHVVKILFKKAVQKYISPKMVLGYINRHICDILNQTSFFAGMYAVIDFSNHILLYSSAGHTYTYLYDSQAGKLKKLVNRGMGMVVGICDSVNYDEKKIKTQPGDRLITHTDGLIECRNRNGEIFGEERVKEVIKKYFDAPAKELINIIEKEAKTFIGKKKFDDDVTIIIVDIKGDKAESVSNRNIDYKKSEFHSVINYYKRSMKLKQENNDKIGIVRDKISLSELLTRLGKNYKVTNLLSDAEKISNEIHNDKLLADTYLAMSNMYLKSGEIDIALEYVNVSLQFFRNLNDEKGLLDSYVLISNLYDRKKNPELEKDYLYKALEIAKKSSKNHRMLAKIYNNLGVSFANESNQEEALSYYHKSLGIADKHDLIYSQLMLMNNIGDVYRQQGKFDESLKYFHKCLMLLEDVSDNELETVLLFNIGSIYFKKGDYNFALYFLKKGYRIAKRYHNLYGMSLIKTYIAYIYLKNKKYNKFVKAYKKSVFLNRRLAGDPHQGLIYLIMAMYKTDKVKKHNDFIKSNINTIVSIINRGETTPDWYFNKALEESKDPLHSDTYIPALYEYGKYLYEKGEDIKSQNMFVEALKVSLICGNYGERDSVFQILKELDIDIDIICERSIKVINE